MHIIDAHASMVKLFNFFYVLDPGDSFGLSTKIDYISVIIGIAIAVVVAIAVIILIPVAKKIIKAHKRHKNTGRVSSGLRSTYIPLRVHILQFKIIACTKCMQLSK